MKRRRIRRVLRNMGMGRDLPSSLGGEVEGVGFGVRFAKGN